MSRICLYYRPEPEGDRWFRGDRLLRPLVRRVLRGRPRAGGVDRVFLNLCAGLDRLGLDYDINLPFRKLRPEDRVGVIGRGRNVLAGYDRPNPIVAAIALMTHPSEWPTLCDEYPVVTYLSHSQWVNDVYRPYFGERCMLWPVGIDTEHWRPGPLSAKTVDILIYNKAERFPSVDYSSLITAVRQSIRARGLSSEELKYGEYAPAEFRGALGRARSMILLVTTESQGIACLEALASGVPVLAWDPGKSDDPERFKWGAPHIPATSVPFFDNRCGMRFRTELDFPDILASFVERVRMRDFDPRSYILENLTLEKCSRAFVDYLDESTTPAAAGRISPLARRVCVP